MPCETCTSILVIYKDSFVCPNCSKLSIVPYEDSLKIAQYYIDKFQKMFADIIQPYSKEELIREIFWEREKQMMSFNDHYSMLELSKLASSSLLIRKIFSMKELSKEKKLDNATTQKIIFTFSKIMDFEEDKTKLKAGNWNIINLVRYDLNNLDALPLYNGIHICPNENYKRVIDTFAKYNIMSEAIANKKMKEWMKDYEPVEKGSNQINSINETIKKFYEIISMLHVAFLRSKVYQQAFQIPNENIKINPIDLRRFNGRFPISQNYPTEITFQSFREELIIVFKRNFREILSSFVLSKENPFAMPLFLKFEDTIILSQSFSELYCYFLHTIVHKKEFNDETERRSKIYEQKIVKKYFEKLGFRYFNNFQHKNKMEIDGLAISNEKVFVIEVKGWSSPKFIEEKTAKDVLTREIKSAINGIRINHDTRKIKQKRSINEKIKWVSDNRDLLKIKKEIPIMGLLIINEPPTITEYLGCKVSFIDDFDYMRTGMSQME